MIWKHRILAILGMSLVLLISGCGSASRHKILSILFDGVPKPATEKKIKNVGNALPGITGRPKNYWEHGPYAAKLCTGCHLPNAVSELVAPPDQLCFQCHDLQLTKKSVHGPVAAGACLMCHDPHSSRNPAMLLAEPDTLCSKCHDTATLSPQAHATSTLNCTQCHDAHMSDNNFLLKGK